MNLRLFIGLPLTSGSLVKISHLEDEINTKLKFNLPWIPLKNLHLTILFLGYINHEDYLKINNIFDIFNRELKEKKILPQGLNLKISKLDYGPPLKRNMIWLYIEKNKSLDWLKNFFEDQLRNSLIRYKQENRSYLPHINLARLKKIGNLSSLPDIQVNLNWSINLRQICLFRSFLKKEGAEYEILKTLEI